MSLIHEYDNMHPTRNDTLDALNDRLGANIKINRLYEWLDIKNPRPLPKHIAVSLRGYVLARLLKKEGVNLPDENIEKLSKKIS